MILEKLVTVVAVIFIVCLVLYGIKHTPKYETRYETCHTAGGVTKCFPQRRVTFDEKECWWYASIVDGTCHIKLRMDTGGDFK